MEPYPHAQPDPDAFAASRAQLEQMIAHLGGPGMMACTQAELEDYVTEAGRELKRRLMQDQLDARAGGERRLEQVAGSDGIERRRAEAGHRRLLATTVGRVEVHRIAYRAAGAPNLHPADAQLALPKRLHSFPLQRQVVHAVAAGSLRSAQESIARATGQHLGTRQLMEIAVEAAVDVRAFYRACGHRPLADADTRGDGPRDLLVLSLDATGVNMVPAALREPPPPRPPGPQPPSAQLASRERGGRSRMAVVTACYDAAPVKRSAADVLPDTPAERAERTEGPTAKGRTVDASLAHSVAPMTASLFDEAERRDPGRERRWIALVDGANHQLECLNKEAAARGVKLDIIVDFVHVLEYVWKAAEDLYPAHPQRATFVQATARRLLEGHAATVVADLKAYQRALDADRREHAGLDRATAYLQAKQPYLDYHIALSLGWPIATGVIEGCCRFIVKDRLDVTGARWGLDGAEAVLLLRAVIANGDIDRYWDYRLQREHERTHTTRYQSDFTPAA